MKERESKIRSLAERWLQALNPQSTQMRDGGYLRLGYTLAEEEAMEAFRQIAVQELQLKVRTDAAGNVIALWEGENELPAIATGSHLDTVAHGGAYDGVVGVLGGLLAIQFLQEKGFKPSYPIEVIAFASEESSRFGISTFGSKAMAGLFDYDQYKLVQDGTGISLEEAVGERDLQLKNFFQAERRREELFAFCELHIEQGPILENAGEQIGVVTAIAAPTRLQIQIDGLASHTGTTPMEIRRERDALLTGAQLIQLINELTREFPEVVATVSTLAVKPNLMNVIPNRVSMGVDIRSISGIAKDLYVEELLKRIESRIPEGITIEIQELVNDQPTQLSEQVIRSLETAVNTCGFTYRRMGSGAGHDAMNMATRWPTGMLFIPCKKGLSHHPDEEATLEDICAGARVLATWMEQVSRGSRGE